MLGFETFIITGLFKLMLGVIGIIMGRFTLKLMDAHIDSGQSNFAIWLNNEATNTAKGVYYGARFIAVAIIIGSAIG